MSRRLVSLSPDLAHLEAEGYDLSVRGGNLVVQIPYVTSERSIATGWLVSEITMDGDRTGRPSTHVMSFVGASEGEFPCDADGQPLEALINQRLVQALGDGLVSSCTFSRKPAEGYANYYDKFVTYANLLYAHVQVIDRSVPLQTFPPIPAEEDESVFRYFDSMTSRARIGAVTEHIAGQRIAIIGLGGTGVYILDAVNKTPIAEIHVFDDDVFLTHNAFRSPGAATLEELQAGPLKVFYHQRTYDAMHRHVIAHRERLDGSNVALLAGFDFVFVAMDTGPAKREIFQALQELAIPFVDCGMGIYQNGTSLGGIIRTAFSHPGEADPRRIFDTASFATVDDDYDQNIQIAELNMLNAAHAVIRWKKHFGFYQDFEHEAVSLYTIDGNHLVNEGGSDD